MKLGERVDIEIEKNLEDGAYIYRAIGGGDHPGLSTDELIEKVLKFGTDKYDSNQ